MHSRHYFLLAISILLAASLVQNADAAGKRRATGGGNGGSGGVFLSTPNPQTPVEHNNRGVELGQKGLWPDAIREHEIALQMDQYNTQWRTNLSAAHLEYGKWLASKGKKFEGGSELRKAMIIDPANAQADAELDKIMRSLGKNPDDFTYRARLADDADVSGQYDTAICEWRRCVKMRDTGSTRAHLGRVLIKAGKQVDGYKELRTAVAANWPSGDEERRELADTHRQLGDILKEFALIAKDKGKGSKGMQRLANAAVEYRRAVTIYPGNAAAIEGLIQCGQMAVAIKNSFDNHLFLGGAYLLGGKFANAQMEYQQCFKLGSGRAELSTARVAYHLAVARNMNTASQEQVADSITKVKKLIDDDPENAMYWYILGRLREHQSDFEKAKKCYEKASSINALIDPDLKQALVRIGVAPPPETAPQDLAKAQEQSKVNLQKTLKEKEFTELQNTLDAGQLDEVIAKGQDLFGKYPKEGRYAGVVGRAYEKKGDADSLNQAKTWYRMGAGLGDEASRRLLEQVDASLVADMTKNADDLFKQGKFLDAKSIYQDILVKAPRRGDVHRKLGDCLKELGDKDGARKEYSDADIYDRGGEPPKLSDSDRASGEAAAPASTSAPEKKAIADKIKEKSAKAPRAEKPPEEQGMKAESLQMQPLKRK